jgi:DNA-binding GntR family transcriptional regulator
VRAILADEHLARLLGCAAGDALLRVEKTGYTPDLTHAFHALDHFRGDLVSLLLERRPNFNIKGPDTE